MDMSALFLSILFVNINGVSSKLESKTSLDLINNYDIIALNEIICDYPFSLPGYKCVRSSIVTGEELRGGVAVLFSTKIWNNVYNINVVKDQVWFQLKTAPKFLFAAIPYISHQGKVYITAMNPLVISKVSVIPPVTVLLFLGM